MNPVIRSIALWLSETFVASALEVILETVIDVWNHSVLKYDLPLPYIAVDQMSNEIRVYNTSYKSIDELLQITENLIDFSQDEIAAENVPHISKPNEDNASECSGLLAPLEELAYTLNNEFNVDVVSHSEMEIENEDNPNFAIQDGAEQTERYSHIGDYGENYEEKTLKLDLSLDNGDSSSFPIHHESTDHLKEDKETQTTTTDSTVVVEADQRMNIIRNSTSEIGSEMFLDTECSELVSSENDNVLFAGLHQEMFPKSTAIHNPVSELECYLDYRDDSEKNGNSEADVINSFAGDGESFRDTPRKVKFSEEVETFLYEAGRSLRHPCVAFKSPITVKESKEMSKNYQSALIIEEVEETNIQSGVIKEHWKEKRSFFQENSKISETVRKVYDESETETTRPSSDEFDACDVSHEQQNRIEEWLKLRTEEESLLLDNMYPIRDISSQHRPIQNDSRAKHRNVRSNQTEVTADRKQSNVLDKICKKLFKQKLSIRN